ncbi:MULTISPECIES: patatin-like phospholipase family protein [Micromonospora]|uniref:patatin-like phospholipase family protein n=2 Tax=Micromonosporaceae TaxID=28056 RepID=UPI0005B814A0|nr:MULTISPECIES: patatin-like phospholipase family protein [unclassified Micromonospora]MCK1807385.1 patatin-like phospholipase family protein [Micromonospora sp. R42106]MCK1835461.1 patatin-like phospholipase family protein [Micromonospora sp. R42003]MCK1845108.1 patatin-like phospholipase family protein [Micromonospora sp. R42004]MCM1016325.1 patatin-like phospholipase family protein [Micromonospora sp. XM-20-01]NHO84331.1 patatin-like phospholipase family protein [Micromonospora sp. CMU55-4
MGRALVLGGGGVTGVAWELGLLAGLAGHGLRLDEAELVVGTSAGSVVGAQVRSGTPVTQLYEAQLRPPREEVPARLGTGVLLRWAWAGGRGRDAARARARIGAMALSARTPSEQSRRAVIAARLPSSDWPAARLLVTAVDAASGEFVVFDADSGASLVDAVGASCAVPGVWPPVTIGDRRFVDGGVRSPVNADLAAGCERVVVLAPTRAAVGPMPRLSAQVTALRAAGARVAVVSPDRAARTAIGRNVLDPARRAASARAGFAQADTVADEVAGVWR